MTAQDILRIRLHNQLLAGGALREPHQVVAYMGAMQAQAFEMAKWGVGVRLKGATVRDVEDDINTGKIIRTHILRPTWHFVAAGDIRWMTELSAPRIRPIFLGYGKTLGIDAGLIAPAIRVVERLLENGNYLTRQEIAAVLMAEKMIGDPHTANYVLGLAEIEGIVCNGRVQGSTPTYALMDEWVPRAEAISREEALERLARRFFTSHGPATLEDFVWWSGMTLTDARKAIEQIKHDFVCETLNGRTFWMRNDLAVPAHDTQSALLLPPFDEFVVSYKDRSELIEEHHYGKVMTKNGLFSPTVMLGGEIVGSWKKTAAKGKPAAALSFFKKPAKKTEALFAGPAKEFSDFYRQERGR